MVREQLRRIDMLTRPQQVKKEHGLCLDADRYEARMGEHALRLTAIEFGLLDTLCHVPAKETDW